MLLPLAIVKGQPVIAVVEGVKVGGFELRWKPSQPAWIDMGFGVVLSIKLIDAMELNGLTIGIVDACALRYSMQLASDC